MSWRPTVSRADVDPTWRHKYPGKILPIRDDAPFNGDDAAEESPKPKREGFTMIPNWVLDHAAVAGINCYAFRLLVLLQHRHRHEGVDANGQRWPSNNGQIHMSRVEAGELLNCDRRTAGKAFDELINIGAIEEITPAKYNGQEWSAPEWRIRYEPYAGRPGLKSLNVAKPVPSRRAA